MTARLSLPFLAAAMLPLLAGCYDNVWWEYRDDPYLAEMAEGGVEAALRNVNSVYVDTRQIALRNIAEASGRARRAGRTAEADRLADTVLHRYRIEKDASVRACIVLMCAPAIGRGYPPLVVFLRGRIASGDFAGYAALSLAYLAPRGALEDIVPLTRHPSPGIRLRAATALAILGDPNGRDAATRVLLSMREPEWPAAINDRPLSEAADSLRGRIERVFGPLAY